MSSSRLAHWRCRVAQSTLCAFVPALFFCFLLFSPAALWAQKKTAPQQPTDPLGRDNPRSAVTAFLEACHSHDYQRAAQYLDLRQLPAANRARQGPELARTLEAILNSDSHFDVLSLSQSPEGNLSDDPNPDIEHVATITRDGHTFTLQLERVKLQAGLPVWVFTPETIAAIPGLTPTTTESAIAARLPRFLVSIRFLDTPLWKWLALLVVAIIVVSVFRLLGRLLLFLFRKFESRLKKPRRWAWIQAVLQPALVVLSVMIFRIVEEIIDPSALSRLYIGRALLLVIVWSFAWCFINVVDLSLARIDALLDPRQRMVSHSLIYLGRRVTKVVIAAVAAIVVLNNWGYEMTTIIAGLGVGGIAVALAAQSTIANVFGGVSVIGDRPVLVGDFGNFGGLIGTVEDIGMRSTRIRTLNRTLVSVPNSNFAGMNLENYALRDKILFNPTFQIKRATPKDQIRHAMSALADTLTHNQSVEVGPSPIRLSGFTSASFAMEIFVYILTSDINEFYKIQAELFLAIDDVLTSSGVELA